MQKLAVGEKRMVLICESCIDVTLCYSQILNAESVTAGVIKPLVSWVDM